MVTSVPSEFVALVTSSVVTLGEWRLSVCQLLCACKLCWQHEAKGVDSFDC